MLIIVSTSVHVSAMNPTQNCENEQAMQNIHFAQIFEQIFQTNRQNSKTWHTAEAVSDLRHAIVAGLIACAGLANNTIRFYNTPCVGSTAFILLSLPPAGYLGYAALQSLRNTVNNIKAAITE